MKDWHKVGAGGSVMRILVWNSQSAVGSTHTYVMALFSTRMKERKERKRIRRQRAARLRCVIIYIYIWNSLSKVCAMVDRQTRFGTPLSSQACWQNRSRACRPQGRGWRVWTGGSARGLKKKSVWEIDLHAQCVEHRHFKQFPCTPQHKRHSTSLVEVEVPDLLTFGSTSV